jgi:hypothetical protein
MKKIVSFLILAFCMLALFSVAASAVTLETEITAGEPSAFVGIESKWTITITICQYDAETLEDVVVQGGIGADLVVTDPEVSGVTLTKKGKGKMGATIVTWDIGTLVSGDCLTLDLEVKTGLNPKDKQEFTSAEEGHELDGGFSATYWYEGIEYETLETEPLTVDVVGVEEE